MLKDYFLPTVPEPDPDSKVSRLLRGIDDQFDGMALEIDDWEPEAFSQRFFSTNFPPG